MSELSAVLSGGTGYLGSRLAAHLAANGWKVHILVRPESSRANLEAAEASVETLSLSPRADNLRELLEHAKPTVVFHLASLFLADHRPHDVAPLLESNVVLGTQLLEAMTQTGVKHLINAGTWWQHFEDQSYSPVCLYAATKRAFEAILQYYVEARGIQAITLKIFDTYGPRDPRRKLLNVLASRVHDPKPMDFPPGDQPMDLVYVDDISAGFLRAATLLRDDAIRGHAIYSLPAAQRRTLRQVVETFFAVANGSSPPPLNWGALPYRPREMLTAWTGGTPLPGWQAQVTLEEGIRKLLGE